MNLLQNYLEYCASGFFKSGYRMVERITPKSPCTMLNGTPLAEDARPAARLVLEKPSPAASAIKKISNTKYPNTMKASPNDTTDRGKGCLLATGNFGKFLGKSTGKLGWQIQR